MLYAGIVEKGNRQVGGEDECEKSKERGWTVKKRKENYMVRRKVQGHV